MTTNQTRLHWNQWNDALKAMRGLGIIGKTSKDGEAARKAIYASLQPPCTSIKAMNNSQFTQFLQICWAWSQPNLAKLQLRQDQQAAIIGRFQCREVFRLISQIDPATKIPGDHYYDAIFAKLNPDSTPDFGTHAEWQKAVIACVYRYDQIVRRALNIRNPKLKCWPSSHHEHLALAQPAKEPEFAENPF